MSKQNPEKICVCLQTHLLYFCGALQIVTESKIVKQCLPRFYYIQWDYPRPVKSCMKSRDKLCEVTPPGSSSHCPMFAVTLFSWNLPFVSLPVTPASHGTRAVQIFPNWLETNMGKVCCRLQPTKGGIKEYLKPKTLPGMFLSLSLSPFGDTPSRISLPGGAFPYFFSCSLVHFVNKTSLSVTVSQLLISTLGWR